MVDHEIHIPEWLDVSHETFAALRQLADLVGQWTQRINLIAPSTLPDLWERHILDSAQLFAHAKGTESWVDLGSGGGFPALVIAILAREKQPAMPLHLVESDQRKCAFLRKASQMLGLKTQIHATRAETLPPLRATTLSARAMAPLVDLLAHVHRHLEPGGRAILPKGARALEEVEAARLKWGFDLTVTPSLTDPNAKVLLIENLHHA